MPILPTDIKLLASERMIDSSDGGGRRTSSVIPDGIAGNIFPKVSRLNSVYGFVNLRKIYGHVSTASLDVYAGAHAVIMDAPDNSQIHVNLFSTASEFDDRTAARDRIESYLIAGPESKMVIYGRQLVGQMAVQLYQRVEESLPEVGDVYCLSKETAGITAYQQFVRIGDITHEVRTFADDAGEFNVRVLMLKIGAPLRYEFAGPQIPTRVSSVVKAAICRMTTVADVARYFGIKRLAQSAEVGSLQLMLESVYSPIVPTTLRESAVSNAQISGAATLIAASLGRITEPGIHIPFGVAVMSFTLRTARPIYPGSLVIGGATDDRAGNITGEFLGTVDYATGLLSFSTTAYNYNNRTVPISYIPAAEVSQPAHTRSVPITVGTRGTVYAETLLPIPAPGTLVFDYRALGKWYRLRDDGTGQITGSDAAYGAGSIDYVTGAAVVTLGALPDVGSAILFAWGSPVHTTPRTQIIVEPPVWRHTLPDAGIEPGSVSISWELTTRAAGVVTGTTLKTVIDDGAGQLTGDGIGRIVYATGQLWFLPTVLPDPGSTPVITYQKVTVTEEVFLAPAADGNGMITIDIAGAPVEPGSVEIAWQTIRAKTTGEKSGSSATSVAYQIIPEPDPPAVVVVSSSSGGTTGSGGDTPTSPPGSPAVVPVVPTVPAEPVDAGVTTPVPTTTSYPLIGPASGNVGGLPIVFQPVSSSEYSVDQGNTGQTRIDTATGAFVITIPAGQTTWGGIVISEKDRLPVQVLTPSTTTFSTYLQPPASSYIHSQAGG